MARMLRAASLAFSVLCLPLTSQTISIDLSQNSNGRYPRHFSVEAANHDPAAVSPEQVFAVNLKLANAGNTEAAFELGLAYLQGVGVKQDLEQAEHWFRIGAAAPEKKSLVTSMYETGDFFPQSRAKAAEWLALAGRPSDIFEQAENYRKSEPARIEEAIPLYLGLLNTPESPEYRRAQMELGNLVIDGKYSAGNDAGGRAKNLEWARVIAQELLGQKLYDIAVTEELGREGLRPNKNLWLRYCKRAAAYNIDLAQRFLAEYIASGKDRSISPIMAETWLRLASQKQTAYRGAVDTIQVQAGEGLRNSLDASYEAMLAIRARNGAYYSVGDPLRDPLPEALAAMPDDDPEVKLRKAFALEKTAGTSEEGYLMAMKLYREVRDSRDTAPQLFLAKLHATGAEGIVKDDSLRLFWLRQAAARGSEKAREMLAAR